MFQQNTRESAVRRAEFHQALRSWLDDSFDDCVGDVESHAGSAWLWVRHGGQHFYLVAGTTRAGVREYLRLVVSHGDDTGWSMADRSSEVRERVAVGPERRIIDGFEFYHHVPGR